MSSNSYTIESSDIGHIGGRYISKTPIAAAKKVATQLFKIIKTEVKYKKYIGKSISFVIRRSTSGKDKKMYNYIAKQVKLSPPVEVKINDKTIIYKNKILVKKNKTIEKNLSTKKAIMTGGGCMNDQCSL